MKGTLMFTKNKTSSTVPTKKYGRTKKVAKRILVSTLAVVGATTIVASAGPKVKDKIHDVTA